VEPDKIKQIVEAAIFAADGPLDRDALLLLFDEQERPEKADLSRSLEQISEDYAERGIELKEVASGFRFQVRKDLGPWVSRLWQEKPPRYSRAILETLALVAYRQPITRGEIEEIRGVSVSSHIIKSLLERNWVRVVGHRDVPGRPAMFATTRQFLDYFDLKSLEDLPPLSEIKDPDKLNEELALSDAPDPDSGDRADDDNDATAAFGARTEGEREARNEEIFAALDEEPELDDSTLMSIDKVDSVNAGFEEEFRRKPAPAEGTGEQAAKAADEDEQSPHE
jgi:segregation and condensation protein B